MFCLSADYTDFRRFSLENFPICAISEIPWQCPPHRLRLATRCEGQVCGLFPIISNTLLHQRQADEEGAAREFLFIVRFAFHPDAALHGFDNSGGNRQPQTGSAALVTGTAG
jgi:hypothetical protein